MDIGFGSYSGNRRRQSPAFAFVIFLGTISLALATAFYHPLRAFETILLLALATAPLSIMLFHLTRRMIFQPEIFGQTPLMLLVLAFFGFVGLTTGLAIYLNAHFDDSASDTYLMTVSGKHVSHGKHSTTYYLETQTPVMPVMMHGFDHVENIKVSSQNYERAVVGQAQIRLVVGRGNLHLPWLKGYAILINDQSASAPAAKAGQDF